MKEAHEAHLVLPRAHPAHFRTRGRCRHRPLAIRGEQSVGSQPRLSVARAGAEDVAAAVPRVHEVRRAGSDAVQPFPLVWPQPVLLGAGYAEAIALALIRAANRRDPKINTCATSRASACAFQRNRTRARCS